MNLDEAEDKVREIGRVVHQGLAGSGWGFMLVLTSLREAEGFSTYISDCNREDMLVAVRDLLDKVEADPSIHGRKT